MLRSKTFSVTLLLYAHAVAHGRGARTDQALPRARDSRSYGDREQFRAKLLLAVEHRHDGFHIE